jgi:replicative DNA helicase
VQQLKDLAADRATGEALAQGMEILRRGVRDDRGEELRGHTDARAHVMAALAVIERDAATDVAPEGDIRNEVSDVLASYAKAKQHRIAGAVPGILSGLPELDDRLDGGLNDGELATIAGWTSTGKTAWCCQTAWDAATQQGRNVVYFTIETLRAQVRYKLIARHSCLPQFGLARGLNSKDLRSGHLDAAGESAFAEVLKDFSTNSSYGRLHVAQVPRLGTLSAIESRLAAIRRQFRPDLVVIDYLQLLRPDKVRRESAEREDMSGILKAAKNFCTESGTPILSPWQINREGRRGMREAGGYNLLHMAGTAEAANTPDVILTLVDQDLDTSRGRSAALDLTVLKNRDGEKGVTMQLTADFATSRFVTRGSVTAEDELPVNPYGDE